MFDVLVVVVTFFVTLLAVALIQWLVFLLTRPSNLPPGPLPLPVIGNIWVFFRREPAEVFKQLNAKYGNSVSIYVGSTHSGLTIMIFDWQTIQEIAVNYPNAEILADRPLDFPKNRGVKEGILWAQYDVAKHRRRLFMRSFKDFGLASAKTPSHVGDELAVLHAAVKRNLGKPYKPGKDITEAVASSILMSVYSQRFDPSDINTAKLIAGGRAFFDIHFFDMLLLPHHTRLLSYLLKDDIAAGERQMEFHMSKWLKAEMERRKPTFNPAHISDVLDAYMATDQTGALEFDGFMRSCVDVFLGAMETTSTVLRWTLFFLAHMPDEQERLFQEIDSVVSGSAFPAIEHRSRLVRLEAFINEALRYSSLGVFAFPRRCSGQVRFGPGEQYQVDANTNFIFIYFTCNFDPEYWLDPLNFRVDRWLDPNKPGQLVPHAHMFPFGIGKRVCPGEAVARNLVFIFLGAFIQRFKWRLAKFVPFDASRLALTRMPLEHELIFSERE